MVESTECNTNFDAFCLVILQKNEHLMREVSLEIGIRSQK